MILHWLGSLFSSVFNDPQRAGVLYFPGFVLDPQRAGGLTMAKVLCLSLIVRDSPLAGALFFGLQ